MDITQGHIFNAIIRPLQEAGKEYGRYYSTTLGELVGALIDLEIPVEESHETVAELKKLTEFAREHRDPSIHRAVDALWQYASDILDDRQMEGDVE